MTVLKKKVLFSTVFIMLLATAIFSSVRLVSVDAMSDGTYAKYKYYTSYEIQPGDTLTSIAERYTSDTKVSVSEYIDEVKQNNQLTSDKITSGKNIIIAYYTDEYKK